MSSAALSDVDVVFIALHGGSGEDGKIQALLEELNIPFTGSGHVGGAIAYESKYQRGGAQEIFPADITPSKAQEIKKLGVRVHKALKLGGYSRVDFRMDGVGIP